MPAGVPNANQENNGINGWHVGALFNIALLTSCLLIEIIMLFTVFIRGQSTTDGTASGVIYHGSCSIARRWTTILSLVINIIATTTIGSSNYIMQCLSAPSGTELRHAHKMGKSLQVGVSSPANVFYKSTRKTVLWWLLALSSIPVHLLFNSAFYSSLSANNYAIAMVAADFAEDANWSACLNSSTSSDSTNDKSWSTLACSMIEDQHNWEELTAQQCIERYSDPLISQYSNVLVVAGLGSRDRTGQWAVSKPNMSLSQETTPSFDNPRGFTVGNTWQDWSYVVPTDVYDPNNLIFTDTAHPNKLTLLNDTHITKATLTKNLTLLSDAYITNVSVVSGSYITRIYLQDNTAFEEPFLEMPALFGIFTSSDYGTWNAGYRRQHNISNISYPSYDPTRWMYHDNYTQPCLKDDAMRNSSNWVIAPNGIPVQSCRGKRSETDSCELLYNIVIIAIIIGCDAIKLMVIALTLQIEEQPCVTIGDVITWFLHNPDLHTEKRCLMDQEKVRSEENGLWSLLLSPVLGSASLWQRKPTAESRQFQPRPVRWIPRSRRWFHVPSKSRWVVFGGLIIPLLSAAAVLVYFGAMNLKAFPAATMWTRGFSTVDPNAIYQSTNLQINDSILALVRQLLLINAPQLFISYLYILYNGLLTTMHTCQEWSGYVTGRKALRVSNPQHGQRSTYWLSLPWRYSLLLVLTSALLHWLISRSLYLVRINLLGPDGQTMSNMNITACGYSILMMVLVIIVIALMAIIFIVLSFRRLDPDGPLIGTSSMAISAACHHPNDRQTESCLPLRWGVTELPTANRPGHCALSSGPVSAPKVGEEYW